MVARIDPTGKSYDLSQKQVNPLEVPKPVLNSKGSRNWVPLLIKILTSIPTCRASLRAGPRP
jgi:hypothetical protein